MRYSVILAGESRSFGEGDRFLAGAADAPSGEVVVALGEVSKLDLGAVLAEAGPRTVLLELGSECLALHVGLGAQPSNVLGFARYRTGGSAPSRLIEIVRLPSTSQESEADAVTLFRDAGFETAVCSDQPGRILDRLVRPKYNAALRLVDEGLATAEAIDLTCRLGLGYAEGPIERVVGGGLADHYRICRGLFEVFGTAAYAPARVAVVAAGRSERGS